ncbi:predicted protein [Nematostella vectensis]|uniref:Ammonium transporter AmtB-like domain-containing protein n=1 Tax=Nematostella vectensis TaxID=45351 RepID=A7SED8_NEMVE|nr:predicted protein [Nematostella vectensis]|eukprot:XP_001629974.1 predicted protein [Nematostella vectensis]
MSRPTFTILTILLQVLFVVIFAIFGEYGDDARPNHKRPNPGAAGINAVNIYYPMFQDVHVMIFLGIGLLLAFLRNHAYSSISYCFFAAAILCEWSTIINGVFWHIIEGGNDKFKIDLFSAINADFAAAVILISYCVVLGKISILQLLVMGVIELAVYVLNSWICFAKLGISDIGASITIHMFAAYFGLGVTRVLHSRDSEGNGKECSSYHNDVFCLVGTIFLWLYWPSFNACLTTDDVMRHRTVTNTYYSMLGACVMVFALSPMFRRDGKFNLSHVQNATLAGGVAIGTASNMIVQPWGSMLIGSIGGAMCTLGYVYLSPFLQKHCKMHDVCGVHNLHALPAFLSGIASAIASSLAAADEYGDATPSQQAGFQVAAMFVTIGISLLSGILTGFLIKLWIFEPMSTRQMFDDEDFWMVSKC